MQALPDRLEQVLTKHRVDLSADQFLSLLAEAAADTSPLTAGEADFLSEHSGIREPLRDASAAQQSIAAASALANHELSQNAIPTSGVASMLRTASANVRRSLVRGELFAAGKSRSREHLFPIWQFHDGRPLPHLNEALHALPDGMHPLDIETVMTTACEPFNGRSPAQWLAGGGDPAPVVAYLRDIDLW